MNRIVRAFIIFVAITLLPVISSSQVSVTTRPHIIQDEGTSLQHRPKINFVGPGVTVTDNPTTGATDVSVPLTDALIYQGVIDCSANPNYPVGTRGYVWRASAAGKIGGASGVVVEINDLILCNTTNAGGTQAAVGTNWDIVQNNIDGVVTGPTTATDNAIARFDGATGKIIKNSTVTVDDTGIATGLGTIYGGTGDNDDITISGTSSATKTTSYVLLQPDGGFVGINVNPPLAPFHVYGADRNTGAMVISVEGASYRFLTKVSGANYGLRINHVASKTDIISFQQNGGVGIGSYADSDAPAHGLIVPGYVGIGTYTPMGKPHVVLSATAPALFGGDRVGAFTACTVTAANKNQIAKTGIGTGLTAGTLIMVTSGTGVTTGAYRAVTINSADLITVDRNIHASGSDVVDVAVATAKDVVTISATDGTNGQMLTSYSAQNKPLQIGGTAYSTPPATATSADVYIPGTAYVGGLKLPQYGNISAAGTWYIYLDANQYLSLSTGSILPADSYPNTIDLGTTGRTFKSIYLGTSVVSPLVKVHGTTGGLRRQKAEAYADITADASVTITLSIPSGARLLGAQLRVDSALAAGELWDAAYSGGSSTALATSGAVAANTKVNKFHADEITTDVTNIAVTKNGGGSFTAQGRIRAIVYYEDAEAMASL